MLIDPFWYGGGDPNFANVVLLLHCDQANGATTLVDSSLAAHSVTCTGSHQITTAQAMFGTGSLDCTTTGAGRAAAADSADWTFGAGQFTVECFIRPTITISGARSIIAQWGGSTSLGWELLFNGTAYGFQYSTTGTDSPSVTGTLSPTLNAWTHIAVDRDASNVLRVYGAGAVIGSGTVSSTLFNSTRTLTVGNDENATRAFTGQIDEVRITKGVARYGGAFTPPTAPFPDS